MSYTSTVLIVDDEEVGREALESLLINQGYRLIFASNGAEALDMAARWTPDLILLDVMMPGMDGIEVCRRVRADPLIAEIPVIIVTSLDDRDSRLEGIEAGADDFIPKPFDRVELRTRVQSIIRLNRYRRLMDERARFEWVVNEAEDGFVIVNDEDQILYANRKAYLYLNIPFLNGEGEAQPLPSETFLAIARQEYQCKPEEVWALWSERHCGHPQNVRSQPGRYLVRPETSMSHALWLLVECFALPSQSFAEQLVRLRDVSEQMSRQRQMWTFHSLITHKLATPQSSLINSLYLLNEDSFELSPEEMQEYTEIVFESARRLCSHIQEIRQYLKTPSLAYPGHEYHLADLPHLVAVLRADLGLEAVHVSGDEALDGIYVMLSQQAIELILREVLVNAHKFHPRQSPEVEIALSRSGGGVMFRITDDGSSLSPEQLAWTWTPYYQAEKGFSGRIPGLGLGLSMIATLVWNVGGHYHMYNRDPGPGIVIELMIPVAQSPPAELPG